MKKNLYFFVVALFLFSFCKTAKAQIITTCAGNGTWGFSGDGGPATAAQVWAAYAVAADGAGNLFISDYATHRIRVVDPSGIINTMAGTGTAGFSGDGGAATAAKLNGPYSVASDFAGNVYIGDYYNSRIRKVDVTTGVITTIAGTGTAGFSGDGGAATAAKIWNPYGVCVDAKGNVYFSDWNNGRIRKIDVSGTITTFAGTGTVGYSGDGGPATAAKINQSFGLAADPIGNIYIGDYGNYRIRVVDTFGVITTFAGNGFWGFGGDGGPATAAQLSAWGVAADFSGNIYIGDYGNQRIRKVDPSKTITTFAGMGTPGFSGDGGPATAALLNNPIGVAIDGASNLYIADYSNYRIRKVNGRNRSPKFLGGKGQSFTVCANAIDSINKLLYIHDSDYWQLETFTDIIPATHGTVHLGTAASNGDTMTPKGFYFEPTVGYAGPDSFTVRVSDGTYADTIKIYVNILLAPAVITGTPTVCFGLTTALSDVSPSGTWTSTNTAVATVSSSGGITTVSPGTTTISYTLSTGCAAKRVVTVNPLPSAISGTLTVCQGLTTTLSNTGGGTWTSSNTAIATAGTGTGIITGVAAGTATITYKLSTGCITTSILTVNPLPATITGIPHVCMGLTTTLSDATPGGTWSTAGTLTATVGSSSGIVTGIIAGVTTITYTLTSTGCIAVTPVTVDFLPTAITGTPTVCAGATTTLSNTGGGGTWSSGSTAIATVGSGSGTVSGVTAGTSIITYTLSTGCIATAVVTVFPLPTAIIGASGVCAGLTTTMSNATPGGSWLSSAPAIAGIDPVTGVVTGISGGTANITYTVGSGCTATKTITVHPAAGFISGIAKVCVGYTTTLSNSGGGSWTSANTAIATAGLTSGVISGVSPGTATITYTLSTGCAATITVTVAVSPAPITGATGICIGTTSALSTTTGGGIWSSSTTSVATVSTMGLASGIAAGSSVITYKVFSTGCISTATVTVSSAPGAIGGLATTCIGSSTSLSNSVPGGTWTSGNTVVATIDIATGVTTGMAAGTSSITYSLGGSCRSTITLTVSPALPAISGTPTVCESGTASLTSPGGGTWTSSTTSIATIGLTSGIVSGVLAGTATVTYTISSGCNTMRTVTVLPAPAAITGMAPICASGGTVTVSSATPGGTWSSGSTAIATAGSGTGVVTGVAAGTSIITYKLTTTGCVTTAVATVLPLPSAISGTAAVCIGGSSTLTNSGGGTWTSGNTAVAAIGLTSGIANGVAAGTAQMTYTLGTGCAITRTFTVNPLPSAISGPTAVCIGANITLTNSGGGTWTSSATTVATIGLTTGVVTGGSLGSTTIVYTLPTGCVTTATVTVSPSPTAILGASALCVATTITLSDAISGGSWTSGNTAVATAGLTSGDITGVSAGTATITYSLGSGCTVNKTLTVNPSPSAISGATTICVGATATLTDATTGGTWSSSNTTVATITSGGLTTGLVAGTTTITYSLGCVVTTTFSVKPTPTAILGGAKVCQGSIITLSDAVTGGTWTSSNTAIATADAITGDITGVNPGSANIIYSLGAGCTASKSITVSPSAPVTGGTGLCVGLTTTLTNAISGGTWSSGAGSIATVVSGVVTGLAPGTAVIAYTLPSGCISSDTVTVNSVPGPIAGNPQVCMGTPTLLINSGGGVWTSSNTAVATIDASTGVVSGVTPGASLIAYSFGSGCTVNMPITVNAMPGSIGGTGNICAGNTTPLSHGTPGGTWNSSNSAVATVSSAGLVSGIVAGTATVSYTLASGCSATKNIIVNAVPGAITGIMQVCAGLTTTLSNTGGGTWSSSAPAKATVGMTTGVVTGISGGTATITYTAGAGCSAIATVTVNPAPAALTGSANMCIGSSTMLTSTTGGGTWLSDDPSVATVTSGLVYGAGVGTATITYTAATGCIAIRKVTVNALPPAIDGGTFVCTGFTTALSNTSLGGTWSSSMGAVATVGLTSGVVRGVTGGTATITYSMGVGCTVTADVSVNPTPAAITGTPHACIGQTTTLASATPGGAWSTGNMFIADVDASGVVSSMAPGTAIITYMVDGCPVNKTVTIDPVPGAVTGGTQVCTGSAMTMTNPTTGGTWSSSIPSAASIGITTGIVTGLSAGTTTIIYTLPTGCSSDKVVTVNPVPATISGAGNVCGSLAITLGSTTPGGIWSSNNTAVATVTPVTGMVSGRSGGTAVIDYTLPTGCFAAKTVTVNPAAAPISGVRNMCTGGDTITLSTTDAPKGIWTSSMVTVSTSGLVTAYPAGVGIVTYTLPTGCMTTVTITVNPRPGMIIGTGTACTGAVAALSDTTSGGLWSSMDHAIATIDPLTGVLGGVSAGTVVISYTLPTGCGVADTLTVYPSPSTIIGTPQVCQGKTTTFSNTLPGGTWSSGIPAIATVDMSTGDVLGISAGTSMITYTSGVGCTAIKDVTVNPLPTVFSVTGGGVMCSGDPGINVLLSGSTAGTIYDLVFIGTTIVGTMPGTGGYLNFGPQTGSGGYTVVATDAATSCTNIMSGSATVFVTPRNTPTVTLSADPGIKVCEGGAVTFTTTTTHGGIPVYSWNVNGVVMGSTTSTYTYTPKEGDVVIVMMVSNASCLTTTKAYDHVTMKVSGPMTPVVTVTADPGNRIAKGQSVTFSASVANGGPSPLYQWQVNDVNITGANSATYTTSGLLHNDVVNCVVTSDDMCSATAKAQDVRMLVSTTGITATAQVTADIKVLPNPNHGAFTIKGSTGAAVNEEISLELTDMLGQVVYKSNTMSKNGLIDAQVIVGNSIASGMYLLNVRSASGNNVFHVVIEQ